MLQNISLNIAIYCNVYLYLQNEKTHGVSQAGFQKQQNGEAILRRQSGNCLPCLKMIINHNSIFKYNEKTECKFKC